MTKIFAHFRDTAIYDAAQKSCVSVRDGVLEYLGSEIGMTPPDQVFRVYRSPATIANAAALMNGLPVTVNHVSLDAAPADPKGKVLTSKMIDLDMADVDAHIGVLNTLQIDDVVQAYLDAGKREMSLGYTAVLVVADMGNDFDLEQKDIMPHHLAIVDAGRCGSVCSFIDHNRSEGTKEMTDKKPKKPVHKAFCDANGMPSMTEIVAIAQALPEALKTMPVDELAKILPTLQEIVKAGGGAAPAATDDPAPAVTDDTPADPAAPLPAKVTDSKAFKDAVAAAAKAVKIIDSQEFKDAVAAQVQKASDAAVARHVTVLDKARKFLPVDYKYDGKTTKQVMLDTLAVEHGTQKFADAELEIAFKMMKQPSGRYQTFGDGKADGGKFGAAGDKEIK